MSRRERWMVVGIAVLLFIVLMLVTPRMKQNQTYHMFADRRNFFGIPNTLNVVSNLPFLFIGIVGMAFCVLDDFGLTLRGEFLGWMCFFFGIFATAFGSSYYHLIPSDARLVWDRLPIVITFSSLMAVFIIERVDQRPGGARFFLLLLLAAGVVSVIYWRVADDLKLYSLVQFGICVAIPVLAIMRTSRYTHSIYWLHAAGWYALAKFCESFDKNVYKWTRLTMSGHTFKHLFAAVVPICTIIMLTRRNLLRIERPTLYERWRSKVRSAYERPGYLDSWKLYWEGSKYKPLEAANHLTSE